MSDRIKTISLAVVVVLAAWNLARANASEQDGANLGPKLSEAHEQKDARMRWWREARFGLFIHWGLYAVPAGDWEGKNVGYGGEWIMQNGQIPLKDYEKIGERFNPTGFDAREWVKMVTDAGMKYIVITSKHHDGFCLWDSAVSHYDVMDASAFKRDIMGELSQACKADGRIRLCFYYSIMDWHHPDAQGWNEPGHYNSNADTKYKPNPNFPRYIAEYVKPQLKELITHYDPGVLWFDGEWVPEYTEAMGRDIYHYCRQLKPDILVNNRVGKTRKGSGLSAKGDSPGDFGTPEQKIPPTGLPGVHWETCMTMNDTWGFRRDDTNFRPAATFIRNLVETASKGGNFLLNVGPMGNGEFPPVCVERLAEIGRWMCVNGESIHGTTASPFASTPWGRATQKPGKVYLHVYEWPKNWTLTVPLSNTPSRAYLLADSKRPLHTEKRSDGLTLSVPASAPDSTDSVIAIEMDGAPQTIPSP